MSMASAPVDNRSEAIYQLGFILSKWSDLDVKGIKRDEGTRDIAVIEYNNGYKKKVNIECDSVTAALRDVLKQV